MFVMVLGIVLAMVLTPIAYEWINRRVTASGSLVNIVKDRVAYFLNVFICICEAVLVLVLPGGYDLGFWNLAIITSLIYFGNQFIFNVAVKLYSRARTAIQHRGAVQ